MSKIPFNRQIVGKTINSWTIIELTEVKYRSVRYAKCQCKCGTIKEVQLRTIIHGMSKCCANCANHLGMLSHGACSGGKIPEYHIWHSIKERCLNPRNKGWKNYGGRGILMCDGWKNSFETFFSDMGPKPFLGASIDRIDNDKGYVKENCRWTDRKTQSLNKRGVCVITDNGVKYSATQWSKLNNIDRFVVCKMISDGKTIDEIKLVKDRPFKDYGNGYKSTPIGWSKKHDCCVTCGTTSKPHFGNGMCSMCYGSFYYEKKNNIGKTSDFTPSTPEVAKK